MATADIDLRRYLLGQLSGEAAADLEAAYFDDDALRARIEREEELLIEAYLLETLDASTRSAFERAYRPVPARWARVETTRALLAAAADAARPASASPVARPAQAAWWREAWLPAGLAAAAALVLAMWQPWRVAPAAQPDTAVAPAPTPDASAPDASAAPPAAAPAPLPAMVSVTLTAGLTRDNGASARVDLPPGGTALTLVLARDGADWAGRSVTIRNVDTGAEWQGPARPRRGTDPAGTAAIVEVPAGAVNRGDYVVAVAGAPDARFVLRIR
ncbi:MAG: hypothetical protein IT181_26415 [Acidobacteria bacterium]|nr:hypothetical protein [Acidobacteriota bacterium]